MLDPGGKKVNKTGAGRNTNPRKPKSWRFCAKYRNKAIKVETATRGEFEFTLGKGVTKKPKKYYHYVQPKGGIRNDVRTLMSRDRVEAHEDKSRTNVLKSAKQYRTHCYACWSITKRQDNATDVSN